MSAQQLALASSGTTAKNRAEEKAFEKIEHALTRRWNDVVVSDADVRYVQAELQKLPPDSYRRVLEKMDRSGLLERFVAEMPAESKPRFLEQAVEKGYLTRETPKPVRAAPLDPPGGPALLKDDRRLPDTMGGLVFESNVRAANDYYAAHREYLARYEGAAMKANGVEDIRALGEPVAAMSVQPGIDTGDADGRALQQAWARQVRGKDERASAYQAISNRMKDLTGEQRPGTSWLNLAAEISVERGGFSMKRGFDAQVTQYGTVRGGESASVAVSDGFFERGVGTDTDGNFETTIGGSLSGRGIKGGLNATLNVDPEGNLKKTAGGSLSGPAGTVGLTVADDGAVSAELGIGPGPTAYTKLDPSKGTLEGGIKTEQELEFLGTKVKLTAEAGAGYQGTARGRAEAVVRGNGVFEPPAENPKK